MADPLRLRCPAELEALEQGQPPPAHEHLAVDIRLPFALEVMRAVGRALTKCPCGRRMVLAQHAAPVEADRG